MNNSKFRLLPLEMFNFRKSFDRVHPLVWIFIAAFFVLFLSLLVVAYQFFLVLAMISGLVVLAFVLSFGLWFKVK